MRGYNFRYVRINRPPTCDLNEATYRLISGGDLSQRERSNLRCGSSLNSIKPHHRWTFMHFLPYAHFCSCLQELKFTLAVTKLKGFFEAYFKQPPPFKLSLVDTRTQETVWSTTIRNGALVCACVSWEQSSKSGDKFVMFCFFFRRLGGQHRKEAEEKACL